MAHCYHSVQSDFYPEVFDQPPVSRDEDVYFTHEGRIIYDFSVVPTGAILQKHYRIRGGKGGFGSMLRAIGSQIEKTTNHEMCRDLSGRRMRDVNTEKKLKEWYANASERERRKMEEYHQKRQRRRELLEQGPLPGHKFSDRTYERQKRKINYDLLTALDSAVESILKESTENKLKPSTSASAHHVPEHKRARLWIEELDNDLSSTDTSSGDENDILKMFDDDLNTPEHLEPECIPQQSAPDLKQKKNVQIEEVQPLDQSDVSNNLKLKETENQLAPETKSTVQPISDEELQNAESAKSLEVLGLEILKASLASRGLKCGGTLQERAGRLFAIKNLKPDQYPVKFLAKTK